MQNFVFSTLAAFALFVLPLPLKAQEKGRKADPATQMVKQFMKQLEKAELSGEQTTKVTELFTKVAKDVSTKRTEAGITQEIMRKRAAASKEAKEAGKKGKEMQAAVDGAVELTEAQKKLMAETDELLAKARIEVGKLLTPEQMKKLPEPFQTNLKEKAGKKKKAGA
ncbi:MAG: hypothetical protein K9M08_23060 [Pirellula sp.]|nr:hypothetical protein [Pirellula sp.]